MSNDKPTNVYRFHTVSCQHCKKAITPKHPLSPYAVGLWHTTCWALFGKHKAKEVKNEN